MKASLKSVKSAIFERALHTGKKSKLGEIPFFESSLKDKHIQDMFVLLAEHTGKTKEEIEAQAEAKYEQAKGTQTHKILHETSAKNLAENILFHMMEDLQFSHKDSPKFNAMIFKKLSMMIEAENPGMFPLQSIISKKSFEPKYMFVPSAKYPEFKDVSTAAATNDGRFIYNTDFMQRLMDFAFIKGAKPKSKKYQANNGEIPDVYSPIEFLILHEILHLVQADAYYRTKYKANAKIINYVGDFRSNAELVKVLGEQLPIGLYSDYVNYDRQSTYKEMYDVVKKALEEHKEDQQEQKDQQKQQGGESGEGESEPDDGLDSHDDHTSDHDDDSINKEYEEDQKGKGQGKDGKPADEEGEGDGKSSKGDISDEDAEALDKKAQDIKEKLSQRKEVSTSEEAKKQRGERGAEGSKNDNTADVKLQDVLGVNWKVLMDKLVKKIVKGDMRTTYTKMHKRSITSATLAVQMGASAVKAGEVKSDEEKQKLIFVIDSSGSMMSEINKIHSQILHVIQKYNKTMDDDFYVVKFSNIAEVFKCSFKKKAYAPVHIEELSNDKNTPLSAGSQNLLALFEKSIGGATTFGSTLVHHLSKATKNGASVMIFTDADVLYGENKEELKVLLNSSVKSSIGIVFSDSQAYSGFTGAFGKVYSKFVTVLD